MSVQSDVHDFLTTIAKGSNGDFIPMDPGKVAEQVGTTRNKVNKTLFNLSHSDKIELQRGQNGRTIIGYKLLAEPSVKPRAVAKVGRERLSSPLRLDPNRTRRKPRGYVTPALDEYEASKAKFERLTTELGDLITAEFKDNAYAEEGLLLKRRLEAVEEHYHELNEEVGTLRSEVRILRGRVGRENAETVARKEPAKESA